jgi:very-short-patch-repair endonuclease
MSTTPRVAALARRQHGVVTRAQLLEIGLSNGAIGRAVDARRLHPVHRGVFAVGHAALSQEARWMAAVLASGPGAVLSHRSAAHLWGLVRRSPSLTDVTTTRAKRNVRGVAVHRTRRLDPHETTTHRGIPVTTVSRTLTDLADAATAKELQRARHEAEIRYHVTPSPINGRRGAAKLAQEREPSRSELERRFRRVCERAGVEMPQHNIFVAGEERDFVWPAERLVVEVDGWETHRTRFAFENDRARDQALARAGWRSLRFTWRQVTDEPDEVAATLRAALACPA